MKSLLAKAITYDHPETLPISVGMLPAAWMKYGTELQRVIDDYPQFFGSVEVDLDEIGMPESYRSGSFTDEWGCVWENIEEGMESIVKGNPIKSEKDIFDLVIPPGRGGHIPHGFMYLKLLDLCGFELAMTLFAEEGLAIQTLIDKVLEYNCYQVEAILPRLGEVTYFGDDLGMQKGLAIGPERWRKYLKPCFKKLYGMVKDKKKDALIYMHTDGCIWEIMPDLAECGVDMINPQYRANGLDNLVRVCKGKIPINLELDRQLFPFATRSQIFDHVGECVESLYLPQGGLGLNAELNYEIPLENFVAVLDALEKYRHYKG
ncbi:MAG: uroporphyrinogen decarboxylase family protein [Eubacteriales bacterium]